MRVFVTGATGFIGRELVKDLLEAGHHVRGLARSDECVEQLKAMGAEVHRGDLADLDGLREGAVGMDAAVNSPSTPTGRESREARGSGSYRNVGIITGDGKAAAGHFRHRNGQRCAGQVRKETDPAVDLPSLPRRPEQTARAIAAKGVRTAMVRLPQGAWDTQARVGDVADRDSPRKRRFGLCRRWRGPLARRTGAGCGAPLSSRGRAIRIGRDDLPCGGGRRSFGA